MPTISTSVVTSSFEKVEKGELSPVSTGEDEADMEKKECQLPRSRHYLKRGVT